MIRNFFLGLIMLFASNVFGQRSVNDFKYVIVPEGYVFLSSNDQYQLNSLSEFLFKKYGFTAFIRGKELPEDLKKNGCMALTADVQKKPGLFLTKLVVSLKDCNGVVIFTSKEGESREKEFKRAYQEALRDAFMDVQKLRYSYNNASESEGEKSANSDEVSTPLVTSPQEIQPSDNASEITVAPESSKSNNNNSDKGSVRGTTNSTNRYVLNNKEFIFHTQTYGFDLMSVAGNGSENLGKIFSSSRDNAYIVKAGDYSGSGYFDAYGNFVLERVNPVTNKLIKDIFARQ